ncbi:MAG: cell division protein FtsL [Candidatus Hydrogenedentota bacterium]|nr:MAG: cell division protein FtsL [Candidatus Hydrogenedentota bacterium]
MRKKKRRPRSVARRNLKNSLRFLPITALLIMTAFIYAWQHTRMNIVGLPIESLRAKKADLVKQNDSIRLRIERLQAPARIESIAREKLGMISPERWQVVALDGPMQPPDEAVETDRRTGQGFSFSRRPAGPFGFLKKRGNFASTSRDHTRAESTPTVWLK